MASRNGQTLLCMHLSSRACTKMFVQITSEVPPFLVDFPLQYFRGAAF